MKAVVVIWSDWILKIKLNILGKKIRELQNSREAYRRVSPVIVANDGGIGPDRLLLLSRLVCSKKSIHTVRQDSSGPNNVTTFGSFLFSFRGIRILERKNQIRRPWPKMLTEKNYIQEEKGQIGCS